jgi:capsular exopolysaccharide synthesis family protein
MSALTNPEYPLIGDPGQIAAAEHFGVMRSRILGAHTHAGVRSIVVTSAQKGEGKTLVCANLALSLGQLKTHRVLLVDGDLRVGGISELFGIQREPGMAEFLQGAADFASVVRPSHLPSLSLVGTGDVPNDGLPTLLEGEKWTQFLQKAEEQFDLVIVDSVPILAPIADFELLAGPCDGIVLIVHLHKTQRENFDETTRRTNGKLIGVVINNVEPCGRDYYSYYYSKKKTK